MLKISKLTAGFTALVIILNFFIPVSGSAESGFGDRRVELEDQLETERNKLEYLEKQILKIKEKKQKAREELFQKTLSLRKLEHINPKVKSIYHSQTPVLSMSGGFYDQALADKQAAEKKWKAVRRLERQTAKDRLNQKRLVLERLQRIKNYEEANEENWPTNPF